MQPTVVGPRWGLLFYATCACVALVPCWILVVAGETASGRLAGAVPCVVAAIPPTVWWVLRLKRGKAMLAIQAIVLAGVVLGLLVLTPTGQPPAGSFVRSRFLGSATFERWSVANVVPEIDQLKLGTYLVPMADPYIDFAQAKRLRETMLALYRPMEADQEYRALGSVMGAAYADRSLGHVYEYVPPHDPNERRPVLLFLHGSGGNFKGYFYLLRGVAEAHRMILLCPSFGLGNWTQPGGAEAIDRGWEHGVGTLAGDPERVFLVALSNGGRGATRSFAAHPERYGGVIFLSAVMEVEAMRRVSPPTGYEGKPVLLLHGALDRRISIGHAHEATELFRSRRALVTLRIFADEDHFLLFSKLDAVQSALIEWLGAHGAADRVTPKIEIPAQSP